MFVVTISCHLVITDVNIIIITSDASIKYGWHFCCVFLCHMHYSTCKDNTSLGTFWLVIHKYNWSSFTPAYSCFCGNLESLIQELHTVLLSEIHQLGGTWDDTGSVYLYKSISLKVGKQVDFCEPDESKKCWWAVGNFKISTLSSYGSLNWNWD